MASTVVVNIISRANDSGFAKASRSLAKFTGLAAAAAPATAAAAQAVGALAIAGASVGLLAVPALGAVLAGMDGIKKAAATAAPQMTAFKTAMSQSFSGATVGFGRLGGVLTAITPQMQGVGRAITGVFNSAASAVARNTGGLQQLATKGAEFVTRLGPGLDTLITKLIAFGASVNVDAIFNLFTQFGTLLGPIISLFTQLSAAAGPLGNGFAILGGIITALTPSLVQIATVMGPVIAQSMTALTPAIGQLGAAFATVVAAAAPMLPVVAGLVAALVGGLGPALPVIVGAIVAFGAAMKVASAAMTVASAATAIYNGVTKVIGAATKVWAAVQWVLNAALAANPIVLIVLAVIALIAVIVLIATKTTWFQTIWQAVCSAVVAAWNWIKAAALAVWQAIVTAVQFAVALVRAIFAAVVSFFVMQWNLIKAAATAVWNGIQSVVSTVAGVIRAVITGAINGVIAVFNRVKSIGSSVFGAIRSIIDTVSSAIGTVVGWVQNLISAIGSIHWPSPPSWLSSMFGGLDPAMMPGRSAFMAPSWTMQNPAVLQLASGGPSLLGLGGLGGRGGGMVIDNSVTINVDGSGIVDPAKVAREIESVLARRNRTTGRQSAVSFA